MIIDAIIVFAVTVAVFIQLIARLRGTGGVQVIYELSPSSHQSKKDTPTFGGVGILVATVIGMGVIWPLSEKAAWVVGVMVAFSAIGFWDDWTAIKMGKNKGFSARDKFLVQFLTSFVLMMIFHIWISPVGIVTFLFYKFVMIGASNATNLTDGLDGLLGGLSVLTLAGLAWMSHQVGANDISAVIGILVPVLLGYLVFNRYPAKIFMGDTGSLALGAVFAAIAICLGNPWILLGFGAIYVVETMSVIIQVFSFKLTGKRVFKMAPIHHHFELMGMSEKSVVRMFWLGGLVATGVTIWVLAK